MQFLFVSDLVPKCKFWFGRQVIIHDGALSSSLSLFSHFDAIGPRATNRTTWLNCNLPAAMTFFIFFEHRNPWQIHWICSLHTVLVNHAACLVLKIHETCFSFLYSSHWVNLWFRPPPPPVQNVDVMFLHFLSNFLLHPFFPGESFHSPTTFPTFVGPFFLAVDFSKVSPLCLHFHASVLSTSFHVAQISWDFSLSLMYCMIYQKVHYA